MTPSTNAKLTVAINASGDLPRLLVLLKGVRSMFVVVFIIHHLLPTGGSSRVGDPTSISVLQG